MIQEGESKTKLQALLKLRKISYQKLSDMIQEIKPGYVLGLDRISKICTGKQPNYHVQTAVLIATVLNVSLDDIVEMEIITE